MKKIAALFTALALLVGLCACSRKAEESTWQEQFDLGVRYLSEGNYEEAILTFTAAIEIDPMRADTYEKLADAYLALSDMEMALQTLRNGYEATGDAWLQNRIDEVMALASDPDFTIVNGVLVRYNGSGGAVTIPNGVTSIGADAFLDCSSLTSVTIPNSVTNIGWNAFGFCRNLASINVASGNPDYASVDGVLFNTDQTLLHTYPGGKSGAYSIPNSVTNIEYFAFNGCSGLTSVTIPDSVISIGGCAFQSCPNLTTVNIPNSVASIKEAAFFHCSSLTSVTISNSVISIEAQTFMDCSSLTSVTIPTGVTNIESAAFQFCFNLTTVTIPSSVTLIGICAFDDCDSLSDINYSGTGTQWAAISIDPDGNEALQTATIHFNS